MTENLQSQFAERNSFLNDFLVAFLELKYRFKLLKLNCRVFITPANQVINNMLPAFWKLLLAQSAQLEELVSLSGFASKDVNETMWDQYKPTISLFQRASALKTDEKDTITHAALRSTVQTSFSSSLSGDLTSSQEKLTTLLDQIQAHGQQSPSPKSGSCID